MNLDYSFILPLGYYIPDGYELVNKRSLILFNWTNDFIVQKIKTRENDNSDIANENEIEIDQSETQLGKFTINDPAYIFENLLLYSNLNADPFASDFKLISNFSSNGYNFLTSIKSYDDDLDTLTFKAIVTKNNNSKAKKEFEFNLKGLRKIYQLKDFNYSFDPNFLYRERINRDEITKLPKEKILEALTSFIGYKNKGISIYQLELLKLIKNKKVIVNKLSIERNFIFRWWYFLNIDLDIVSKKFENNKITENTRKLAKTIASIWCFKIFT